MSIGLLVLSFLLVLGPLILLHEFGHFIAAKRAGIRVLEFGMGYPPRILRLWRGKGWLTIGGTRIEIPRNFKLPKGLAENQSVVATTTETNGRLTLKSMATIDDKNVAPADATVAKEMIDLDGTPLRGQITELDPGTEYTLNWLPLGGFVRMFGEEGLSGKGSFTDAPKRWRTVTLLAGPGMNLLTALVIFTAAFMLGWPKASDTINVTINKVAANSPAAQAGLRANDVIRTVDGNPIHQIDQMQQYVGTHAGQLIALTVEREGRLLTVNLTPRTPDQVPSGQGSMGVELINNSYTLVRYPLDQALNNAFGQISDTISQMALLPSRLLRGAVASDGARIMGPVGISQLAGSAVQQTVETGEAFWILNLVAAISLALAITNLLPLPALDGGRLLFVIIEAIRGRRIPPEREAMVHLIGMAFLLTLMFLITIQDIRNL